MRFVKNYAVKLCLIFLLSICSCNDSEQEKTDTALIMKNYSDDMRYTYKSSSYFIPLPVYQEFITAFNSFNPAMEYDETMLKIFSPDYIRSNIHELYSIWLNSKTIPCVIQFPNRKLFDKYVARLEKKPKITKNTLKKLLKFEYTLDIVEEGTALDSPNYISIDESALYNGEWRYWLSDDTYSYFFSDDFARDINECSAWINEKKWNDLNSTISRKGWTVSRYTFDPSNNLPVINNIDKVAPLDSETTYITKTGQYVFDYPHTGALKTFENDDGSLDILYTENSGQKQGVRIYLSGAVTEIDSSRRVVPK